MVHHIWSISWSVVFTGNRYGSLNILKEIVIEEEQSARLGRHEVEHKRPAVYK
jgi:hypothetical protein